MRDELHALPYVAGPFVLILGSVVLLNVALWLVGGA